MRFAYVGAVALAGALAAGLGLAAQGHQDVDQKVAGGGIFAPGWQGKIDPQSARRGSTIKDSKFKKDGDTYEISTGPAAVYWDPSNKVTGDFTAKATFKETGVAVRSGHPHPYGIFIGGSHLDTDQPSLVYCVAYGDGTFLVREFSGGKVTTLTNKQPNDAVHKAGEDKTVTNEVGWNVHGSRAECQVNGTVVAGFDKDALVGSGKLDSLDGIVGVRVAHNVDVTMTGFSAGK